LLTQFGNHLAHTFEIRQFDADLLIFFEKIAEDAGIPYQTLINLTLRKVPNEDGQILLKAATSTRKPK
jgi:hypothetical protein